MAIVGIDFGARRVGIAVSDSGVIATAHSILKHDGSLETLVARILALPPSLDATLYVVGIPRRPGADTSLFEELATLLRQRSCKEVVLWDETLTTVEAEEDLRARGRNRRQIRDTIDMEAARVILQSYLDAHQRREP